jgi:hypothetical protein
MIRLRKECGRKKWESTKSGPRALKGIEWLEKLSTATFFDALNAVTGKRIFSPGNPGISHRWLDRYEFLRMLFRATEYCSRQGFCLDPATMAGSVVRSPHPHMNSGE